jgi:hypothetical protein
MRLTLKYKRGDRIYNIRRKYIEKEHKFVPAVRCTKFECYLIYPEDETRIYYKCAAVEHWYPIENLYPTREKALKAIEKGVEGE